MAMYRDAMIVLDVYQQLQRGCSMSRMKSAAKRLRELDPANEMLPELERKIAQTSRPGQPFGTGSRRLVEKRLP